jgi:hypothetical protein
VKPLHLTTRTSRYGAWLALMLAGLTAVLAGGCSDERSYMVVRVRALEGEYTGLTQFKVYVSRAPDREATLFYPSVMAGPFKISTTNVIDFSVSFPTTYTGILKVGVEPLDSNSIPVGYGEAERAIDPGEVSEMDISVVRGARVPEPAPICQPTKPNSCGAGKACYLGCTGTVPGGFCADSTGAKKVGESCATNTDCESGSQCLAFPCGRMCMKFCETNADCAGRDCYTDIPCGANTKTGVRICSQTCDPRTAQMMNSCLAGFACLIFPREVVSCDCPQTRPRGDDGMECTSFAECKPGLVCVGMGGPKPICRPLCKRSDNDCPTGRVCTVIQDPEMNTSYLTWGACVPALAP